MRIVRWIEKYIPGTFGAWAAAMFLISLVSGVLLAVHFDASDPYASLKGILLFQPWASLFRNIHFWSSQFFMVFTLIHFWGYIRKKFFKVLRSGVWLRLILGIILLFVAMFTGFLLKGDPDSDHASTIFSSLISSLPLVGESLAFSILGKRGTYLLPYVHHIATATIFLLIIIREHARKLWTGSQIFLASFTIVLLFSFLLTAPLHNGHDAVVKGPWYFLGVQELLHWLPAPALAWWILLAFVLLVFLLRYAGAGLARFIRITLLVAAIGYIGLNLTGAFFRGANWDWSMPGKGVNAGRYPVFGPVFSGGQSIPGFSETPVLESCLVCHDAFTGFSPGHDPAKIGCSSCHGGNPYSMSADMAHRNMLLVPGNLEDAGISCSSAACHPDILPRIEGSLMTSMSGIIAVDEWVFGESADMDVQRHVDAVGYSAAGTHLRNLCLSCHLGRPKTEPAAVDEDSRGGGCLACHISYSPEAAAALDDYRQHLKGDSLRKMAHPRVGLEIGNAQCFGCHSRSGRISTNYEGWHETLLPIDSVRGKPGYRIVQAARVFTRTQEDVHHKAGMLCIDCHSSWEVMGDGNLYAHEEDAVGVSCSDCHAAKDSLRSSRLLDYEARKILALRYLEKDGRFLQTKQGRSLLGTTVDSLGLASFKSHVSGTQGLLKPPAEVCVGGDAHTSLDCNACHAGWAPRCIGCHTAYDKKRLGNDLYSLKDTKGSWFELSGGFLYGPPGLGVTTGPDGSRLIRPVVPGMIMTLDKSGFPGADTGEEFLRLFAPSSPHTTQAQGRDCVSCHMDPVALGYGAGKLEYEAYKGRGRFVFIPEYENLHQDGLPADAWIGFLSERDGRVATRKNLRPFNIQEQQDILRVGACLSCHPGSSALMLESLDNFQKLLERVNEQCLLPEFPH